MVIFHYLTQHLHTGDRDRNILMELPYLEHPVLIECVERAVRWVKDHVDYFAFIQRDPGADVDFLEFFPVGDIVLVEDPILIHV